MRLPRVVAGASLIVALALVAVPGPVGSRAPAADLQIDPAILQRVEARADVVGMAVTTPTLDPAYRSSGTLGRTQPIVDPVAPPPAAPESREVGNPAVAARVTIVATPPPTPAPTPVPQVARVAPEAAAPAPQEPAPEPAAVDTSSGGWNYDPDVSWYGPGFYGNRTGCGGRLDYGELGVAHKSLPCGTKVTFRHRGRSVRVPVMDRGPYVGSRE